MEKTAKCEKQVEKLANMPVLSSRIVQTYVEKKNGDKSSTFPVILGIRVIFGDGVKVKVTHPYTKEEKIYLGAGTTVFYSFRHKKFSVTPKAYVETDGVGGLQTNQHFEPVFTIPEKTSSSHEEFKRLYSKCFIKGVVEAIRSAN